MIGKKLKNENWQKEWYSSKEVDLGSINFQFRKRFQDLKCMRKNLNFITTIIRIGFNH